MPTPLSLAQKYFDAWNSRVPENITRSMTADGTYLDPVTRHPVNPEETATYASGLWATFPDLAFELRSVVQTGDNNLVAEWVMSGTNSGSFRGLPPTGKKVTLTGIDVIETGESGVKKITGYFDSAALPQQLGLLMDMYPASIGPFSFGRTTRVSKGDKRKPAVVSITSIVYRDQSDLERIRELGRAVLTDFASNPGFITGVTATAGGRGVTLSAWDSQEAAEKADREGAHGGAMKEFFKGQAGGGGQTSIWNAAKFNTVWAVCGNCGRMTNADKEKCHCGAAAPEPLEWM